MHDTTDDLSHFMNVKRKPKMPEAIAKEGMDLLMRQLVQGAGGDVDRAKRLVQIAQIEYPTKPLWWQFARALWELNRGCC
ncbi:MAG TPA: hypothetical protein V6D29_05875 [Leptolyngbyaceae cyanobacterium]